MGLLLPSSHCLLPGGAESGDLTLRLSQQIRASRDEAAPACHRNHFMTEDGRRVGQRVPPPGKSASLGEGR